MIFMDTGPLVAIVCKRDQYHQKALEVWEILRGEQCLTTDLIVVETVNLLAGSVGGKEAVIWARRLYGDPWIEVVQTTKGDMLSALPTVERMSGRGMGLADAVSFLIMDRYNIREVATFDRHFRDAGYQSVITSS